MKNRLAPTSDVTDALPAYRAKSVLNRAQAVLAWLDSAWTTYRRHVREMRYLEAMSERELRDLGLTRLDVRAIVAGYYRPR
jgi:uncharacterized protein YjiS (DUF1127 family)